DLADASLGHNPGGEIDRVALDRVRASEVGTEVTREHRAAIDAGAQREDAAAVDDLADHAEHAFLVVAAAAGSPGDQHDLAAVAVDVGFEKGDVVIRRRVLDVADAFVQRRGD